MSKHWAVELSEAHALIAEEAALLSLRGIGINEQVKLLKAKYPGPDITRTRLMSLRNHPKYQEIKKKTIEFEFENGTLELKKMAVDLLPDVAKCLKDKLNDGDTRAAALVVTLFTGSDADTGPKQAQQLNITLASDTAPKIKS